MKNDNEAELIVDGRGTQTTSKVHQEYLNSFKDKAQSDSRLRAVWLEGSFGKGTADRYSDIDAHLLIDEGRIDDFRADIESWLASIRPLVLFRLMFQGKMVNCLTTEGLRVDLWLHAGDAIALGGRPIRVLLDREGSIGNEKTQDPDAQTADIADTLERQISEFWRCIAILPTVLGRGELITGFIGVNVELTPLTHVLMADNDMQRDTGVLHLNPFISPDAKLELEQVLAFDELTQENLARIHLRLARMMQRYGPGAAGRHNAPYPHDLERVVIRYVSQEFRLLGLASCLDELR